MITAVIDAGQHYCQAVSDLWQWDYGQTLRIQGVKIPAAVEVQFSTTERIGETVTRIGVTKEGVTEVPIPDTLLEGGGTTQDYTIYAFVYIENGDSGKTEYRVSMKVRARPKPEAHATPEEGELFRQAIVAVAESADRAESARESAETASDQAEDVKNAAEEAADEAKTSKENAETAAKVAEAFKTEAEAARSEAVRAATESTDAKDSAEKSRAAAEKAKQDAEAAKATADVNKEAAETAQAKAEVAQKAAENAETETKKAQTAAETARRETETAKAAVETMQSTVAGYADNANVAKESAETARSEAENAKNDAVQAKEAAEKAKIGTAADRGTAETASKVAQISATSAEESKKAAERSASEAAESADSAEKTAQKLERIIDEKILEAFFGSMKNGRVYQTEFYLFETNPTSAGTKTLANDGKVCEPSTDTVEGRDDYEGIGIFAWFNCNYITDDYGRKIPTAIEGWGNDFKNDGSVDVGVIAMTPYWNVEEKDGKQIWTLSDTPNDDYGLVGWEAAKKEDGTFAPYVIHSKYVSGTGTDGLLRSFKNSKPARNQSHNNMITNYQKKGKGYWGGGKERNLYKILYQVIKYATKNEQSIFAGTASYNLQYTAAVQRETEETYFPVTNAQAANIIVGSCVSVGYGSLNTSNNTVNNDRGISTIHKYADDVKVLRIEDLDENNKAVYLDITEGFATTPVAISDTVNAPIIMSTMYWWSGSTDRVIGKHDGSLTSNTDGKHPYRIMGVEDAVGGYIVYADSVMVFKKDYSKDVYIARRGTKHVTDEATIKSTYKLIGNIPANDGADFWIGDIGVDTETCAWFVKAVGSSDRQGWGDRCYAGGKNTSGTREDLGRGALWSGSFAGAVCVYCGAGLGGTAWDFLGCD